MEIRFVNKPWQDENTKAEERQYGDGRWMVHMDRNKEGESSLRQIFQRLESDIIYRIEQGEQIELGIYLYDVTAEAVKMVDNDHHTAMIFFRWDYIRK